MPGPVTFANDLLTSLPWKADVGIIVPEMLQVHAAVGRYLRHDDLEIAVLTTAKIALDDAARAGDIGRDALPVLPWHIHVGIVVPVMPQLHRAVGGEEGHEDLEVAMRTAAEITLNDAAGGGDARGHDHLSLFPRKCRIGVVPPEMHELIAAEHHGFEIAVCAAEIALDQALQDCRHNRCPPMSQEIKRRTVELLGREDLASAIPRRKPYLPDPPSPGWRGRGGR